MKKINFQMTLVFFLLSTFALISCGQSGNKQEVKINTAAEVKKEKANTPDIADASFVDGMTGKVFHNYLQLKTALVRADVDGAQTAAGNMAEGFTEERATLKSLAQKIADADDLEKQRNYFSEFTAQVEPLFKENLNGGKIYKQFCPMAFDNEGASWFSDVSEIRNPYFGDKMLKCGSVKETIQ